MFAGVEKPAYLSHICRCLFVGVYFSLASTAALLWLRSNSAAVPAQGFVVHLHSLHGSAFMAGCSYSPSCQEGINSRKPQLPILRFSRKLAVCPLPNALNFR